MATIVQELEVEPDKFYKELVRLLKLLASQQRLVANGAANSVRGLPRGETGEAHAVLAARRRFAARLR
jgi:hypothetical protein